MIFHSDVILDHFSLYGCEGQSVNPDQVSDLGQVFTHVNPCGKDQSDAWAVGVAPLQRTCWFSCTHSSGFDLQRY